MYYAIVKRLALVFAIATWAQLALAETPSSSLSNSAASRAIEVKLHETFVLRVHRGHGNRSASERAQAAKAALEEALKADRGDVRTTTQGDARVILAGGTPVIELYPEDAQASGDASLDVLAGHVAARARDALRTERARSDLADGVFSISLVVLFGLIALYVLRKLGALADQARTFVLDHPERFTAIRVQDLEVIGAGPLRGTLLVSLIVGRWLAQIGVVYVWLVLTFSQFASTRPYTGRLTSFVVTPLSELAGRLISALPIGLLALFSAALLYVLLRFVELFFASATRGETDIGWLSADLIAPASLLIRIGLIVLTLVFAGPVVTGDSEGSLARVGSHILLGLSLAATPLLASVVIGIALVFTRRVRAGEHVAIGSHTGRIVSVGLFDMLIETPSGDSIRIPYLLTLVRPMRHKIAGQGSAVEIIVAAHASLTAASELLMRCALAHDPSAQVELTHVDADGAVFTVCFSLKGDVNKHGMLMGLAQALHEAGVPLGRRTAPRCEGPLS